MMHTKDGFHCCYNIQTAVDSKSHLIAEYKVTNNINDQQMLSEFAGDVKKALSKPVIDIVADKGYDSRNEIEKTNISIEVKGENSIGCFIRSEDKESVVCPMGFTRRN